MKLDFESPVWTAFKELSHGIWPKLASLKIEENDLKWEEVNQVLFLQSSLHNIRIKDFLTIEEVDNKHLLVERLTAKFPQI